MWSVFQTIPTWTASVNAIETVFKLEKETWSLAEQLVRTSLHVECDRVSGRGLVTRLSDSVHSFFPGSSRLDIVYRHEPELT